MYTFPAKLISSAYMLIEERQAQEWQPAKKVCGKINRRSIVDSRDYSPSAHRATLRAKDFHNQLMANYACYPFSTSCETTHLERIQGFRTPNHSWSYIKLVGVSSLLAIDSKLVLSARDLYRIYDTWIRGRGTYSYPVIRIDGQLYAMKSYNDGLGTVISLFKSLRGGL